MWFVAGFGEMNAPNISRGDSGIGAKQRLSLHNGIRDQDNAATRSVTEQPHARNCLTYRKSSLIAQNRGNAHEGKKIKSQNKCQVAPAVHRLSCQRRLGGGVRLSGLSNLGSGHIFR